MVEKHTLTGGNKLQEKIETYSTGRRKKRQRKIKLWGETQINDSVDVKILRD